MELQLLLQQFVHEFEETDEIGFAGAIGTDQDVQWRQRQVQLSNRAKTRELDVL
jgi:hypothetical protein